MKYNNLIKSVIFLFITGLLTFFFFQSINVGDFKINGAREIRQGIDLRGGIYSVLYADYENPSTDQLNSAKSIIDKRLQAKGIFDASTSVDKTNGRIIAEIPWKAGSSTKDVESTLDDIGKLAMLTFREVSETEKDPATGDYLPTGNLVVSGDQVISSKMVNMGSGQNEIELRFNEEGAKKFAEATTRLAGTGYIGIFLDQNQIMAPFVKQAITGGEAYIEMANSTPKQIGEMAQVIAAGALPFKLIPKQTSIISPILGESALKVAIFAGILAFILICLFMIAIYRLPGIMATLALTTLAVLELSFMAWTSIALTLPGIAGLILTLGMGVDANVIIFERIKEEIRTGKTISASIDLGFKRAFSAIFDSNITTVIVALVLIWLGSGPIRGFAITLLIGVMLSFFTCITVTRAFMKSLFEFGVRDPKLYGVSKLNTETGRKANV